MSDREAIAALRASLDDQAAPLRRVERVEIGDAVEYRVGGRAVVVAEAASVSFRVGAAVAAAAARTVGAAASQRGRNWVELAPSEPDGYALDRAAAWFDLAVRSAGSAADDAD